MLKPSIPETVTLIADNLRAKEAVIRDLTNGSVTAIRLFTWHMLTMLGHSDAAIAKEFQTTSSVVADGIAEWKITISRIRSEPAIKVRILAELNNPIPATTL